MWPGQQPPGGEQNPQDQNGNPYQQPGYQQPNPYQQPGFQQPGYPQQGQPGQQPGYPQPNPYQQPTVPQYAVPGGPGKPGPDDRRKTTVVAVVAAAAVVLTAVVTGFVVMNNDTDGKGGGTSAAGGKASPSAEPSDTESSPAANPRGGEDAKPTVPGWKVVTNPKWGTQFDVPGDWEVAGTGVFYGFEDEKKGDGSPAVGFSAPAHYKSKWCVDDSDKDGTKEDTALAGVGTKGAQGAKSTDEAATAEAGNWVWGAYAQTDPKNKIKVSKAQPYTTKSGLTGSVATATATGLAKKHKCDTDGKSIAFSFKNGKGVYASWILYANAGVGDELPDATIQKILSTVRLAGATTS
jgi:Cell division protein